jgi:3-hydroxyacyl-CoA dehydrogenase
MTYRNKENPDFLIVEEQKNKDSLQDQFESFEEGKTNKTNFFKEIYLRVTGSDNEKAVIFFQEFYYRFLAYCSRRLPEIADDIYKVDEAIKTGFGWKAGPFEIWDMLGLKETADKMKAAGYKPADWVQEMIDNGNTSFYKKEESTKKYYDFKGKSFNIEPWSSDLIFLDNFRNEHTVWKNKGANIIHIGDGALVVEFTSKKNTVNLEVMEAVDNAIDLAEQDDDLKAVIIGNEDDDFSLGADITMIGKYALVQNKSKIKYALKQFQDLMLRIRYSSVPVVVAPHGKTLGGGFEFCLYADRVQAAAETYMGLVEVGVGLIPAGGGTTAMARRATEEMIRNIKS